MARDRKPLQQHLETAPLSDNLRELARRGELIRYPKGAVLIQEGSQGDTLYIVLDGRLRVYACTLVDDDPDYDQGGSLAESLGARVMLRHHRCFSCFKYGASCSEAQGH